MAPRKPTAVIAEMLDALIGIENATAGKSFDDFEADWLLQRGIERGIEIISEAARHLPDDLTLRHPEIPWKEVRGIGNLLRHEYHKTANRIIWAVVTEHLPPLKTAALDIRSRLVD